VDVDGPECDVDLSEEENGLENYSYKKLKSKYQFDRQRTFAYKGGGKCISCCACFDYYSRHPWFRLALCFCVMNLNVLNYIEDPIMSSVKDVEIPFVGEVWNFLTRKSPNISDFPWFLLWFFIFLLSHIWGPIIGYQCVHKRCFKGYCKLNCCQEYKGSWISMLGSYAILTTILVNIYKFAVINHPEYKLPFQLGFSEALFGKIVMHLLSWTIDSFTLIMTLDTMLQDKTKYRTWCLEEGCCGLCCQEHWCCKWRGWWEGTPRFLITFIPFVITNAIVGYLVWYPTGWYEQNWLMSNEYGRSWVAASIFAANVIILAQDWDFPNFDVPGLSADVKIVFLEQTELQADCKCCGEEYADYFKFQITGQWMNYSLLIVGMVADAVGWFAHVEYFPEMYAQYTDPKNPYNIWSVTNRTTANAWNETQFVTAWDARQSYRNITGTSAGGFHIMGDSVYGRDDIRIHASFTGNLSSKMFITILWSCPIILFAFGYLFFFCYFLHKFVDHHEIGDNSFYHQDTWQPVDLGSESNYEKYVDPEGEENSGEKPEGINPVLIVENEEQTSAKI